jgi:nucleoside-diphosphate-sugar epimerase
MSGPLLITGANGSLGARCVEKCAQDPTREVVALWHGGRDRLLAKPPSHIRYFQCDLTDRTAVEALFDECRVGAVLHSAGLLADTAPAYMHRAVLANILATANLADCAAEAGCDRFVYCSTIKVYGAAPCPDAGWDEGTVAIPISAYGWTKHAGEECVRLRSAPGGLTGVSLRLAGFVGPGRRGGVVYHMMRAAVAGEPLLVNNPANRFQLVFLDDAVDGALRALERPLPEPYQAINVASHGFASLHGMGEHIIRVCDSRSPITVGATSSQEDGLMNTARMGSVLGLAPSDLDAQLQRIRGWLEARSPH